MTRPKKSPSPEPGWLTIGSLARETGIPSSTLRTWERRYRIPHPRRKPSGHRLYPADVVRHLRALRRALELGRTPAEVMPLPLARLEALVGDTRPAGPGKRGRVLPEEGAAGLAPRAQEFTEKALAATLALDRAALRAALLGAWGQFGPLDAMAGVVAPFLRTIGNEWAKGRVAVRQEHFAASIAADVLREARRPYDDRAEGPAAVAATLPGDLHEIGLLCVSLVLSMKGWRVAYLGPDSPVREIESFAVDSGARGVAVSVSSGRRRGAPAAIAAIRAALPRGVEIWLGGGGAPRDVEGAAYFEDLASLEAHLAR